MAFGPFNKNENSVMSEINVTPLVDVMLVLLIIFMITMPILTQSIPLELPTANVEKKEEPKDIFRVAINPTGIYLGETLVNKEELRQALLIKSQENKNTIVAISADISVEYQHIVTVLELAQNAGLTKIGFVTQPSK